MLVAGHWFLLLIFLKNKTRYEQKQSPEKFCSTLGAVSHDDDFLTNLGVEGYCRGTECTTGRTHKRYSCRRDRRTSYWCNDFGRRW